MTSRTFTRNRIRGVSFHHARSSSVSGHGGSRRDSSTYSSTAWTGPSLQELQNTAPQRFGDSDLHRLLADQGRQEIHSLVSDAVEHLGQLRQLSRSLQRFAPEEETHRQFLNAESNEDSGIHPMQEMYVEVMRIQRLWKLRLETLEMIVMAQNSLRYYLEGPGEKHRRRAAAFVPTKK